MSPVGQAISVFIYFHADPLTRKEALDCQRPELNTCGRPDGDSFLQRVDNWAWILEEVLDRDIQAHLELGPDVARAWSGDDELLAALGMSASGGMAEVVEASERAREVLVQWVAAGHTVGLHSHGQTLDHDGVWGTLVAKDGVEDGCDAWLKEPMAEIPETSLEEAVYAMAWAGQDLLDRADLSSTTFDTLNGAVPRRLENTRLAIEDPDSLEPSVSRSFPPSYAPVSASQALSECMYRIIDHPSFSAYPLHDHLALASGDGPMILPSVPALGHLDERFGAEADSTAPAALRRLLQLLVNWRYQALMGHEQWTWTFSAGNHLFDLSEGLPGTHDALGRESYPDLGNAFRGDFSAVLDMVQQLSSRKEWHGVSAPDGLLQWRSPREIATMPLDANPFNYAYPGTPRALTEWDIEAYPYLPLVGLRLQDSHFLCTGALGQATVYGFMRCEGGWQWGADEAGGASCLEDVSAQWVYLLLADTAVSVPRPPTDVALWGSPVEGVELEALSTTGGEIQVPLSGLLLEAAGGGPITTSGCP